MNKNWSILKKLVLIWVLVGTLFLLAVATTTFLITSKALEENVQFQVKELAPFLNSALTTPILQKDYATVSSIIKELTESKSIYDLTVLDVNNNVIARSTSTLSTSEPRDENLIKAKVPLQIGDLKLGFVILKLSKEKIIETQNNIFTATIYVGIIAILIFIAIAIVLGRYITNPIVKLANFSKNYNNNDSVLSLGAPNRSDEIGDLYIAYESMLSKIKKQMKEVDQYAFYDPLTKLANRRLVMDRLEQAQHSVAKNKLTYAVLLIDIDRFKSINDSRGHPFGDQILITFAERILSLINHTDTASRLGGDEFVILLSDLDTSPAAALKTVKTVAETLHKKLSEPYHVGNTICSITPSIGVAFYSDKTGSVNDLLKEADLALYEAKKTGL
jgi:diguanylate cyclase (GGDEF)-like protein